MDVVVESYLVLQLRSHFKGKAGELPSPLLLHTTLSLPAIIPSLAYIVCQFNTYLCTYK
jgi:hypothetical protein